MQKLLTRESFEPAFLYNSLEQYPKRYKRYVRTLLTMGFIFETDLISEFAQFKSLKNQKVKREKVTQEVKSKESRIKLSSNKLWWKKRVYTLLASN